MSKDTSSDKYLDLKTELRSILISSQEGCTEQQLLTDYLTYNGKQIPFREMGYKSLMELLKSMPDVARIAAGKFGIVIHGVSDENTAHIKEFVMRQKKNKKSAYARGGASRMHYANRSSGPAMYQNTRKGPTYANHTGVPFQPFSHINNVTRSTWDTPDLPKVSTSTINDTSHRLTPSVTAKLSTASESKVASFPPKDNLTPPLISSSEIASARATPNNDDTSSMIDGDMICSDEDVLGAYDDKKAEEHGEEIILLRKRVRQLLLKCSSGLWLSSVERIYKKSFNEEFYREEYGFKNLMTFFDCISDFVDARRDPLGNSTDRLFTLKSKYIEVAKREQLTPEQKPPPPPSTSILSSQPQTNSPRPPTNETDTSIVDLSLFVPLDFQYKIVDCTPNQPFSGFLGDVQDPWNLHVGNKRFIPKRDRMMSELQDHYNQTSNQPIYNIPYEQIQIHLSCVYYHTDRTYYRAFIYHIDPTPNNDILVLKIHLLDYGKIISDVIYGLNSSNLKFLHRKFSTLSCQIYECRLANIGPPSISSQKWPDEARQLIEDLCIGIEFFIEIVGFVDSLYLIHIWIDPDSHQSINQLLVQRNLALEVDDSKHTDVASISSNPVTTNGYIDEKLLSRTGEHHFEYDLRENHVKQYVISIEHAYYFVKHPFTRRPCLPCFEVARLLDKDETFVSQLNLVRAAEIPLKDLTRTLFDDLQRLNESSRCPHINRAEHQATIILYDLSCIRDYLLQIKFKEGDVIDAFQQEYDNYERLGYWNEKRNSYINDENIETRQEYLVQHRDLLNLRKEQLVSLSKTSSNLSTHDEMQTIDNNLNHINQELHSMETILPSIPDRPLPLRSTSTNRLNTSSNKLRETLFRIARPLDQQFSLNVAFNHQIFDVNHFPHEDIQERFVDLYRITKNIHQFFLMESELPDEHERTYLSRINSFSMDLLNQQIPLMQRIDIYHDCVRAVMYFQPIIYSHVQRTDLIDVVY